MLQAINILTLVGAVQGIFFGLVLLGLPGQQRLANRFLALFLLSFSITTMGAVAYVSRWILNMPHLAMVHSPLGATMGGPLVLFLLALTHKDYKIKAWHWAILGVPFLTVLIWLLPFYRLPAAEKRAMLEASYAGLPTTWTQVFVFSAVVSFGYIVATFVLLQRHERVIREVYSNTRDKSLIWVRQFIYAGFATFGLCVLVSYFGITWADTASNFFFSIIMYVFGYRALRQPEIFADVRAETLPEEEAPPLVRQPGRYEKSGLSEAKAGALLARLEALMEQEKIYLDPMLNLQQLADRLDLPPHQLSQLLNQVRGESFSDFVNRYRVEDFKERITDPAQSHLSLLGLAYASGFNSKAAFNAVFKKMTGETPSAYREKTG